MIRVGEHPDVQEGVPSNTAHGFAKTLAAPAPGSSAMALAHPGGDLRLAQDNMGPSFNTQRRPGSKYTRPASKQLQRGSSARVAFRPLRPQHSATLNVHPRLGEASIGTSTHVGKPLYKGLLSPASAMRLSTGELNQVPRFKTKPQSSCTTSAAPMSCRALPEFYRSYQQQQTQYSLLTFLKTMKRDVTVSDNEDDSSTLDVSLSEQIAQAKRGEEINEPYNLRLNLAQ
jgi:hypothetical protein